MTSQKQGDRIAYLDVLRILACFAVIMIHVCAQNWTEVSADSFAWKIMNLYSGLARFSIPLFLMISGVFFLHPKRSLSIKDLYGKYILRMVTAFLFWSVFYAVVFEHGSAQQMVLAIIKGHYHLWYILMIIGIYMVTPILRQVTQSKELTKYFLLLSGIFTVLIPTLIRDFSDWGSGFCKEFAEVLEQVTGNMAIQTVLGYSFVYVLGYFLFVNEIGKKTRYVLIALGPVSVIYTILGNILYCEKLQVQQTILLGYLNWNVILPAVSLLLIGKYGISKTEFQEKTKAFLFDLSGLSFGVYLVHIFVLEMIKKFLGLQSLSFGMPLLMIPVNSILIFVFSLIGIKICSYIPICKKYMM